MTDEQVSRYIDLMHKRMHILTHSGVDWKPEYTEEIAKIDKELAELRPLVEQEKDVDQSWKEMIKMTAPKVCD